jgi:hypothetical protein
MMFATNALEFRAQDQCWDAYYTAYSEGLREGVNRAMNISPGEDDRIREVLNDQDRYDPKGATQRMKREWTRS